MRHRTWPIATPKTPVPARAHALCEESLFDLAEFSECGERSDPLGLHWSISRALLERVEDVPFAALPDTCPGQRLAALRVRAEAALGRAREHFGEHFIGALMFGFTVDFAAALPRSAQERTCGFMRMHCGPDETGAVGVTLLEPSEFDPEAGGAPEHVR